MRDVPAHAQIPCPLSKGTVYPIAWPERPCGARVPLVGHPNILGKSLRGRSNQPMLSEYSCAEEEVSPTGLTPLDVYRERTLGLGSFPACGAIDVRLP